TVQVGDANGYYGASQPVSVAAGGAAGADLGITPQPSSVSGTVFDDDNGNGSFDNGEAAVAGATVTLYSGGSPLASTTTDWNGAYSFGGLLPGTYTAAAAAGGYAGSAGVAVTAGGSAVADVPLEPQPATVTGSVFYDDNADGSWQPGAGEGAAAAVTVTLFNG